MDSEKQRVIANLLNNVIQDEWEAIEAYNSVIATLSDYDGEDIDGIIANLEDIRDEEYVHVGQLESCLSVLKGDPVEQIGDGSEEGFEKLELPEEDEDEEPEYEEPEDDSKLEVESLKESVSEAEMKDIICSMITQYDASEEEVYDELSIANPDISRDLVHRLYQMCGGNAGEYQQETSFEDFWNELEDTEEDQQNMAIEDKMRVKVYMDFIDAWGEVYESHLIAAFRNRQWARDFIEMVEKLQSEDDLTMYRIVEEQIIW